MPIHTFNKILIFSILSFAALSEYRVYQYMVSPRLSEREPASFIVTSTLDPTSYISYHGGQESLRINLLKTWSCKGHTGTEDLCNDPLTKLEVANNNQAR